MFADTLLRAQQLQLFRLLVWGAGSFVVGTVGLLFLIWRRGSNSLVRGFVLQMTGWGVLELAYAAWGYHGLRLLDVSGATHLDRLVWLNLGVDLGAGIAGVCLGYFGWRSGRRLLLVGSGMGMLLQSAALFLINAQLAAAITR